VKIRPDIDVDPQALAAFCHRYAIRRLALFGSALGDDFGPSVRGTSERFGGELAWRLSGRPGGRRWR
jgi:hypothetical protein